MSIRTPNWTRSGTQGRAAALLGLSLALAACSGGNDDLQRYVAEVKARKTTQIEPIPQMKQYEAYAYVADDRRDPFVATLAQHGRGEAADGTIRPDLNRNKEPLEEFPIDALRLVGVVTFNNRIYAMIKAPDGVIHRVTLGDHLGQNYGRITKVAEAEVTLSEIIPDGFGAFIERPATLAAAE
ncbi:MAG: type 4a pilus biogenesis lipoprotein PilP [Nevskia sp.]